MRNKGPARSEPPVRAQRPPYDTVFLSCNSYDSRVEGSVPFELENPKPDEWAPRPAARQDNVSSGFGAAARVSRGQPGRLDMPVTSVLDALYMFSIIRVVRIPTAAWNGLFEGMSDEVERREYDRNKPVAKPWYTSNTLSARRLSSAKSLH